MCAGAKFCGLKPGPGLRWCGCKQKKEKEKAVTLPCSGTWKPTSPFCRSVQQAVTETAQGQLCVLLI